VSLLALENVTVRYGMATAVRDVSLTLGEGEAVALIGSNGAGKTTTLKAIAGAVPLAEGRVVFEDRTISGKPPEQVALEGLAMVPEGRRIFGSLTVAENLRLGMLARRRDRTGELERTSARDFEHTLKMFPVLKERSRAWAGSLSGGEQQQLAIARALLSRPRLLLLDEPSLGLAPLIVEQIFETLARLRKEGQTMLLVEQNAVEAVDFAERIYVLRRGRVSHEATHDELKDKMSDLADLYMGLDSGLGSVV
jgi:branched-chain amino acid transport system ATP-binding protein